MLRCSYPGDTRPGERPIATSSSEPEAGAIASGAEGWRAGGGPGVQCKLSPFGVRAT
jgi:hypothetical protein